MDEDRDYAEAINLGVLVRVIQESSVVLLLALNAIDEALELAYENLWAYQERRSL
jgi:hypothetical protein